MGVPPTGREVAINMIDVVRLRNGRYLEHGGVNGLPSVLTAPRDAPKD